MSGFSDFNLMMRLLFFYRIDTFCANDIRVLNIVKDRDTGITSACLGTQFEELQSEIT
jgi:hypothetical protein